MAKVKRENSGDPGKIGVKAAHPHSRSVKCTFPRIAPNAPAAAAARPRMHTRPHHREVRLFAAGHRAAQCGSAPHRPLPGNPHHRPHPHHVVFAYPCRARPRTRPRPLALVSDVQGMRRVCVGCGGWSSRLHVGPCRIHEKACLAQPSAFPLHTPIFILPLVCLCVYTQVLALGQVWLLLLLMVGCVLGWGCSWLGVFLVVGSWWGYGVGVGGAT